MQVSIAELEALLLGPKECLPASRAFVIPADVKCTEPHCSQRWCRCLGRLRTARQLAAAIGSELEPIVHPRLPSFSTGRVDDMLEDGG